MKLSEYVNLDNLRQLIADGYINERRHPTLPLRILNYSNVCQFDQYWPHEVCACRGLIVDDEDNIVSRPFYKFFNLGQPSTILTNGTEYGCLPTAEEDVMVDEGYLYDAARFSHQPLVITRKMDGQFGESFNYDGHWGISTRGSFESDGAKFGTEKFQKFVKYGATEFIPKGWTLIFEIIAMHLRIVIPYQWEGLCLLAAVHNETGEEMPYDQLHELWVNLNSYSKTLDKDGKSIPGKPWCRIVEKFDIDIAAAQDDPSMEEEGYVVSLHRDSLPPLRGKIKLAEYKRLHKLLTGVTPQMIWNEIANPLDGWLAIDTKTDRQTGEITHSLPLPSDFTQWIKQWRRGMTEAFHKSLKLALKMEEELQESERVASFKNNFERKRWLMSYHAPSVSQGIASAVILLREGKVVEAYDHLWKLVRPHGKDETFYAEGKGE